MVHRREIAGQELVLGNQGDLFKRAMTWWDHSTGSVWSQPSGEAILGPRKGQQLELLPSTLTTWDSWRAEHPDTLALWASGGASRFSLDDLLVVVDLPSGSPVGVPFADLRRRGVVNLTVGGEPVAVTADPGAAASWSVLSRRLPDGRVVELSMRDGTLEDDTGDLRWGPLGRPRSGQAPLEPLPAFTSFPSDFASHFPGGRIVQP